MFEGSCRWHWVLLDEAHNLVCSINCDLFILYFVNLLFSFRFDPRLITFSKKCFQKGIDQSSYILIFIRIAHIKHYSTIYLYYIYIKTGYIKKYTFLHSKIINARQYVR